MSDFIRQFFPATTTAPVPPIRDKAEQYVGGERLAAFNSEVEDLARVIHSNISFSSARASLAATAETYGVALEAILKRHEFTKEFTPDEKARIAEQAAQKARNEKFHEEARKKGEALREAERIDRLTREQAAAFQPRSVSTQKGSPAYAIERARYIAQLNEIRAAHSLSMLSV